MTLPLTTTHERGVAILKPGMARLDASVAPAFRAAALAAVEGGDRRVVLDLEAVQYLDSSGLGAMVSLLKAVGSAGQVCVCNAQGAVLNLFKLTRMDKVFAIEPGVAQAVQRLAGGA